MIVLRLSTFAYPQSYRESSASEYATYQPAPRWTSPGVSASRHFCMNHFTFVADLLLLLQDHQTIVSLLCCILIRISSLQRSFSYSPFSVMDKEHSLPNRLQIFSKPFQGRKAFSPFFFHIAAPLGKQKKKFSITSPLYFSVHPRRKRTAYWPQRMPSLSHLCENTSILLSKEISSVCPGGHTLPHHSCSEPVHVIAMTF